VSLFVEMRVQRLGFDRSTRSPVVVLRERQGGRVLPIWIGPNEASAIASRLAGMRPPRPLTHDLTLGALQAVGARLLRVHVTRVEEQTYFAELILRAAPGQPERPVDARPSDAIALALRAQAPILASDALLTQVTMELSEAEQAPDAGQGPAPGAEPEALSDVGPNAQAGAGPDATSAPPMTPRELEEYLRALDPEDFGRFTP
jgi:bifunctional DNase/RNase